jgi:hypothetical protein
MGEGLNELTISEAQFNKLPMKQQNKIIFKNTEQLKTMINNYNNILDDYKFHQRIQYAMLAVLASVLGIGKFLGFM